MRKINAGLCCSESSIPLWFKNLPNRYNNSFRKNSSGFRIRARPPYRNYHEGVVDYPFIADLEAGSAVPRTDKTNKVGGSKNDIVPSLPFGTPSTLKAFVGTGTDQFYIRPLFHSAARIQPPGHYPPHRQVPK